MKNNWFLDIEVYPNLFLIVANNLTTDEYKIFKIFYDYSTFKEVNDIEKIIEWINTKPAIITFNGLNYDYPVIHWVLKNHYKYDTVEELVSDIHNQNNYVIRETFSSINKWEKLIPILDLFKIHHFDNKSKHASLKWLEINMQFNSIKESKIDFNDLVTEDDIDDVINYCKHDVLVTKKLYDKSINAINLRKELTKKYNIDLLNDNDAKIGEKILLDKLSKSLNINKSILSKRRTFRNQIVLKDIIFNVSFNHPELKKLLDYYNTVIVNPDNLKGSIKYEILFNNVNYTFGLGGLHASVNNKSYDKNDDEFIVLSDVKSYYPNLAIRNRLYPNHLGNTYCKIYEEIYNERTKHSKNSPENYALKIALNGAYGKSNDKYSFLYDPQYTLTITINGQLYLMKLIETVYEKIPNADLIFANTDGVCFKINSKYKDLYFQICNEWQIKTNGLILEHDIVNKLWIRDVNNYIINYNDNIIKTNGAYELNDTRALNKDFSNNIIRKAIYNLFANNIPIEETIYNGDNIYDYCLQYRANKGDYFIFANAHKEIKLNRYVRLFITNNDEINKGVVIKQFGSDKQTVFNTGHYSKLMIDIDDDNAKNYNINYNWYIKEANKLIVMTIPDEQLTLNF
jgi:hypothetical protein